MEALLNIWSLIPEWIQALCGLVSAATAVTALTPSKSDDHILNSILKILNMLAGNVGHNKNADAE
jgi:hypothetical protein|tara:strand:+ start:507 stop:701 length:195 start_codon:yes stop_codon:yes gene_type:complete